MKSYCSVALVTMSLISLSAFAKEPVQQVVERPWLIEDEKNTINVFEKAAENVVFVSNSTLVKNIFSSDIFEVPAGAGTGFIWDSSGYIVTNYHVIENARKVTVTLKNGKKVQAKVIGAEPRKDVALLKIEDTKGLPAGFSAALSDSSQLVVGQKTIAIGNPFELNHTLTTGVVSALNRTFPSPVGITIRDMIQTDAAINPGNSGGPLMDSRGYLIGMNTAIFSQSGTSAGVGFAVPVNTIKRVVNQLIKYGKINQPALGVEPLPERYSQHFKVKGVIIKRLMPGGPAQKAGLHEAKATADGEVDLGDVITTIDGVAVLNVDDIYNALENKQIGDKITVDYLRKGVKKSATVLLEKVEY
jgi:S1-C subfamily serine protease